MLAGREPPGVRSFMFWGWLLLAPAASAGGNRPVWLLDGPGEPTEAEYLVDQDGWLVELRANLPRGMSGPITTGEVALWGSFVSGFLSLDQREALAERYPELAKPIPPVSGVQDILRVMLDAGHGGSQLGAVGVSRVPEKKICLEVAQRVRQALGGVPDIEVVMTRLRDEEVSLWDRVDVANQARADLFISLHANAYRNRSMGGVETFFHSVEASGEEAQRVAQAENALREEEPSRGSDTLRLILEDMQRAERLRDSSRLAHLVQAELARALPFVNRGVMQADFIVLGSTRMPAVLIELGFLTNRREEKLLQDPRLQEKIAQAVKKAILQHWEVFKHKQVGFSQESRPK